jgi:hypothetical protein
MFDRRRVLSGMGSALAFHVPGLGSRLALSQERPPLVSGLPAGVYDTAHCRGRSRGESGRFDAPQRHDVIRIARGNGLKSGANCLGQGIPVERLLE